MNPSPDEPVRTSRRFWGCWWRRALLCLGALAALVGIFYAEEDWRGQRDWNQYRQATEARGESLDFRAYIPKPVPDEENFAAAPIVEFWTRTNISLTNFFAHDLFARADNNVVRTNTVGNTGRRYFLDLVAWQMASVALQSGALKADQIFETDKTDLSSREAAAPAVLEGMKTDAADFAELRLASIRPYAHFPVKYDVENLVEIPLMHIVRVKQVCQRLNLQACAELAARQPDKALADVRLVLYLAGSIKTEPIMISHLVRQLCIQIAVQPVWEGLAEHHWTESQLQELEECLQHYDFLADLNQSLKVERAAGIRIVDYVRKKGLGFLDDLANVENANVDHIGQMTWHKRLLNLVGGIMPTGWYDEERLDYCTFFDAQMKGALDLVTEKVFPRQIASNCARLAPQLPDQRSSVSMKSIFHHQAFAGDVVSFLSKMPLKAAAPQTAANQAAIACALERYRLANGHFPETLESLTPQFMSHLPKDVITGQPYKYRHTEDGQYILYSVGWNEKDDGGVPGKTLFDQAQGDWVWAYPTPGQ
jgi:hypothetical protein